MTPQEYHEARVRAQQRAKDGYADNGGAPWHSVSCACLQCLSEDARFIGIACVPLRDLRLFSR